MYSYVTFYVFGKEDNITWHLVEMYAGHVSESRVALVLGAYSYGALLQETNFILTLTYFISPHLLGYN